MESYPEPTLSVTALTAGVDVIAQEPTTMLFFRLSRRGSTVDPLIVQWRATLPEWYSGIWPNSDSNLISIGDAVFAVGEVSQDFYVLVPPYLEAEVVSAIQIHVYDSRGAKLYSSMEDTIGNQSFAHPAPLAAESKSMQSRPSTANVDALSLDSAQVDLWQYASSIIAYSSQYSSSSWSAQQALGEPDTFSYGDLSTAWAPLARNADGDYAADEFLTVGFTTPVYALAIQVRQTYGNGFIRSIEFLDNGSNYHLVWQGLDGSQPGQPVDFFQEAVPTTYLVVGARVNIDIDHNLSAWEEIDAISLYGIPEITSPSVGIVQFQSSHYYFREGDLFTTVTLVRDGNTTGVVSTQITITNNSASATDDVASSPILVSFEGGEVAKTVEIRIHNDSVNEPTETFDLSLLIFEGEARLGSQSQALLTIYDDDPLPAGSLSFSSTAYGGFEGGNANVVIQRSGGANGEVSALLSLVPNTALKGKDYTESSYTVLFPDGVIERIIGVKLTNDSLHEQDEIVGLTLSEPLGGATLGLLTEASLTVVDDDPAMPGVIELAASTFTVNEGGSASLTLSRTGGSDGVVNVELSLIGDDASQGTDFARTSYIVHFLDGDTEKSLLVTPIDDTYYEGTETIRLALANPSGGAVLGATSSAVLSIIDNEKPGLISFHHSSYTASENGSASIRLLREGGSDGEVTVILSLLGGSAIAGEDYSDTSIVVQFQSGELFKDVLLPLVNNRVYERTETIGLKLSNPTGGAFVGSVSEAVLEIADDDLGFPYRVADIRPGPDGSIPDHLVAIGTNIFFTADDGRNGSELWKSDGTADGTALVSDIRPGASGSSPGRITAVGTSVYFVANDGVTGTEIWMSDGSISGTKRVTDIRSGSASSAFGYLTAVASSLYFVTDDGIHGQELWKSDGTSAGTVLVSDIRPGLAGSSPSDLFSIGNTLYFRADDGNSGFELWKTDGTSAGTVRVADIRTGAAGSIPSSFAALGQSIYFSANDGISGEELWRSDGTAEGTFRVVDIFLGPNSSRPRSLLAVDDAIYFSATDGVAGSELWKTEGSLETTVRLSNVFWEDSTPYYLTATDNTLYYVTNSYRTGSYTLLMASNGNALGAVILDNSYGPNRAENLVANGNSLFFSASLRQWDNELWRSDGSRLGTREVADINKKTRTSSSPRNLTIADGKLFFTADDGLGGRELWILDDNAQVLPTLAIRPDPVSSFEGTTSVKEISFKILRNGDTSGTSHVFWSVTANSVTASDFEGNSLPAGRIDFLPSSSEATVTVRIYPDDEFEPDEDFTLTLHDPFGATLDPASFSAVGRIRNDDSQLSIKSSNADKAEGNSGTTELLFTVQRSGDTTTTASASWRVQGISADPASNLDFIGQSMPTGIVRFLPGQTTQTISVKVAGDTAVERTESFLVELYNPIGTSLHASSSTATGSIGNDEMPSPYRVVDINPGAPSSSPSEIAKFGNTLYFFANDGLSGAELWRTDGTADGTTLVADIQPGAFSSGPRFLTVTGDTLFFSADDGRSGNELWTSDGTADGTVRLTDVQNGSASPSNLVSAGKVLYFVAYSSSHGVEIWSSDGTAKGTGLLADVRPGIHGSNPNNLTVVGDTLYFTADDGNNGRELWKSNGRAGGTVRVSDINSTYLRSLTPIGNTLYFIADHPSIGRELWKLDGSTTGAVPVADLRPGPGSADPLGLTAVGDTLYFTASADGYDNELWSSDGTEAGTRLVANINRGRSSNPYHLTHIGETLYFAADDGVSGRELWRSDGTSKGTVRIADINPGSMGSGPRDFQIINNALYFTAEDRSGGRELWFTDNTHAGTVRVADIYPGLSSSTPSNLTAFSNKLFFTGNDGIGGTELWSLDSEQLLPPSLALVPENSTAKEGNTVATPFTFSVKRTGNISGSSSVEWFVRSTQAVDADFNGLSLPQGAIEFVANESSKTITIFVASDTTYEQNESFIIHLANPEGATIDPAAATAAGLIIDDDARGGVIQFDSTAYFIKENGAFEQPIRLNRSNGSDGDVLVMVSLTGGSATPNLDYKASPVLVSFANGETSKSLSPIIYDDSIVEPDEDLVLTLIEPSITASIGDNNSASLRIVDNDQPSLHLRLSVTGLFEGDTASATVTRNTQDTSSDLLVALSASDLSEVDIPPLLVIPAGQTSASFAFSGLSDSLVDSNQQVLIIASSAGYQSSSASLTIRNNDLADVVVENISAPSRANSGQAIDIQWTLANVGSSDASGPWTDRILLSNNDSIGDDILLGTFVYSGSVAPGSHITRTQTISLPVDANGDYRIVVQADIFNQIKERRNASHNNTLFGRDYLHIDRSPSPNLVVTSISAPENSFSGEPIEAHWDVANTGSASTKASGWVDRVWLSLDQALDRSDIFLGQVANASYLNEGESYRNRITGTLPVGIDGNYYIIVSTDATGLVWESALEADNIRASSAIDVDLTPPPDLRILSVTSPASLFSGQKATLTWSVLNGGRGSIYSRFWYDELYLSVDSEFQQAEDIFLGRHSFNTNSQLDSQGSYSQSLEVSLPTGLNGLYYILARTDAGNVVFEQAFEQNNIGSTVSPVNIRLTPPPDLEVEFVDAPSLASSGRSITISYRVANNGSTRTPNEKWTDSLYLSTNKNLDPYFDVKLGDFVNIGSLEPGQSYLTSRTLILPQGIDGTHYVYVITDSSDNVYELDNHNNSNSDQQPLVILPSLPDLVVTGDVSQHTFVNGGTIRVNWRTSNDGSSDTGNYTWSDRVILSTDQLLGNYDDIHLDQSQAYPYYSTFISTGRLAAGSSYNRSELLSLPFGLASGDYFVYITTDTFKQLNEGPHEGNNASQPIPISITRRIPDLSVISATTESSALSGQPFGVSWRSVNQGTNRPNKSSWQDRVFLSADRSLDDSDILLGTAFQVGNLGPSEEIQTHKAFTLAPDLVGTYYVLIQLDASNDIHEEAADSNNIFISALPTTFQLSPVPDLIGSALKVSPQVVAGQNLDIAWSVKNDGSDTSSGWRDAFYLSRDQILDETTDSYLGFTADRDGLKAGQSYAKKTSLLLPRNLTGEYYLLASIDGSRSVYEREGESNNLVSSELKIVILPPLPTDLVAGSISIPFHTVPGQPATITYTVKNQGDDPTLGVWLDSIYISKDDKWDVDDPFFAQVRISGPLGPDAEYTESAKGLLPGVISGDYKVIVRSDIRNSVRESEEKNNLIASLDSFDVDYASLALGIPVSGYYTSPELEKQITEIAAIASIYNVSTLPFSSGTQPQEWFYYKVDVGSGETLKLSLDATSSIGSFHRSDYDVLVNYPVAIGGTTLYVKYNEIPTPSSFDFSFSSPLSEDQQILIPSTQEGTYYILTSAPQLWLSEPETPTTPTRGTVLNVVNQPPATTGGGGPVFSSRQRIVGIGMPAFTLTADIIDFSIQETSVSSGSNRGSVTIVIRGAKFTPATSPTLITSDGEHRVATQTWWKDNSEIWVTFDLRGLSLGSCDIRLSDGTNTTTAHNVFLITDELPGKLETQLIAPGALRPGEEGVITINYANTGHTDIVSPLLSLGADTAGLALPGDTVSSRGNINILAIDEDGPAGILSPGDTGSFSVRFVPNPGTGIVQFSLSQASETETLSWEDLKLETMPAHISSAAWDATWANFITSVGTTSGSYQEALADNANYLSQLGNYVHDVNRLLAFELQKSSNSIVGSGWDGSLEDRLTVGPFGRGEGSPWEISLTKTNGEIIILYGNTARLFRVEPDGSYHASLGDTAILTLSEGLYHLREADGTLTVFRNDGHFDYIEDPNGIRLSASYVDGRLTRLENTWGNSLAFSYNAFGLIMQVMDEDGHTSNYEYDASGESLLSVATAEGITRYTYYADTALFGSHRAIQTVTFEDNTTLAFEYDNRGRVTKESWNNGARVTIYQYDSTGGVAVTDALGYQSQALFNEFGMLARLEDPLNRLTRYHYDTDGNLTCIVAPDNTSWVFTYDADGNVLSSRNALGHQVKYSYEPAFKKLAMVQDHNGNPISYGYDSTGNLTAVTYADGSLESFSRDSFGNVSIATNRRGQSIQYTYNSQGLLIRKQYQDGTSATYSYDGRGNLLSAIDADSSVNFAYDNAERLTKVTYGPARYVEYGYDSQGRRTRMASVDGLSVNYVYDDLGQLSKLTDVNDANIITYTYDGIGHLLREDNGNGTYTTYSYDHAGQLLSLANYKADGTVNSRYDYTYDVMGRRTSMATLEGTSNYVYDAIGRLTGVSLPSGRSIQYYYDAAGNRIAATDSGLAHAYSVNNLNQYSSAGDAAFAYDVDGNLIRKQDGNQAWEYIYDIENRLTGVNSGAGSWVYEYDAIGNRIATSYNGVRTEYMVDPVYLGDVIGEYDGDGHLIASYAHGVGLVSRIDSSGAYFYDSDAIGSVVGLTGSSGNYVNKYTYLPFGEHVSKNETVSNPFEYVGQWGIMDEDNGLRFMRARYYDANLGRFTAADPIGIFGGLNLYGYTTDPLSEVDPTGLSPSKLYKLVHFPSGTVRDGFTKQQIKNKVNSLHKDGRGAEYAVVPPSNAEGKQLAKDLGNGNKPEFDAKPKVGVPHWHPYKRIPKTHIHKLRGSANLGLLGAQVFFGVGWWIGTMMNNAYGDYYARWLEPIFDFFTRIVRASDPNDIVGPDGFGEDNWLLSTSTLPYTIRFENQASATAPAQVVTISHPLDSDLDLRTFRLGDFGWGGISFDVPDNAAFFSQRLDLTATKGFLVDVAAGIDIASKQAFWTLTTIDPNTGEIPEDPSIGFLPPNNDTGIGDGFVNYTIRPGRNVTTGAVIDALATIVFDNEAPIDTPPIFNTLDAAKPTSAVKPLAASSPAPDFLVQWGGDDGANGSGVASFDVYVSENGGLFSLWLEDTTLTEASFRGQYGKTYGFYSIATDNVGQVQETPPSAQAQTQVATSTNNQAPVLRVNKGLSLAEGSSSLIGPELLQVEDADNINGEILFTLHAIPSHGVLKLDNVILSVLDSFTLEAINQNRLSFSHDGSESIMDLIRFGFSDGTSTLPSHVFGITINPLNDVPVVASSIPAQTAVIDEEFSLVIPATSFQDDDLNEVLAYSAHLASDRDLPAWLHFDPATRTLRGTPQKESAGVLPLVISAKDTAQSSVSQGFDLTISAGSQPVNQGPAAFSFSGLLYVGQTLSVVPTSADPDGDGPFSFTWQSSADGVIWSPVGTLPAYEIPFTDQGRQLRVLIDYTDGQGFEEQFSLSAGTVLPPLSEERVVGLEKTTITSLPTPELATGVTLRQGEDDRPLRAIGVDDSLIDLGGRQSDQHNTVTVKAAVESATADAQAIGLDGSEMLLRPGDDTLLIEASAIGNGPAVSIAIRNSFFSGNRGDDTITLRGDLWGDRAIVFGGAGNDRITGHGIGRDSFLQAGSGDDRVSLGRLETTPGALPLVGREGRSLPVSTYRGGDGFDVLQLSETTQAAFEAEATWFTTAAESGWLFQGARFSGFEQINFG